MGRNTDYFHDNPVALMEINLSPITRMIDALPANTFADILEAVDQNKIPRNALLDERLLMRANDAMISLLKASSQEELSLRFPEVIRDDATSAMVAAVLALRGDQGQYQVETTNHRLDGVQVQLRLSMRRSNEDRHLNRVLVAATDISRDVTLREQIRTLAMMPETNPNMVMTMECGKRITYANPTARKWMTGQGLSQLDELHRLLPDNFWEQHCARCDRRTQRNETYERDGRLYDLKITPVLGENRCVLYANDVTDAVRIQQERDIFAKAIEAGGNAIAITDARGAIEYVNPSFERLYGFGIDEARGKNPRIINPGPRAYWEMGVSREEYTSLFAGMWGALSTEGKWEGEVLNKAADGDLRWIHLIINRIAGAASTTEKYLAVATDIETMQRKELEARIEILSTITKVAELRDNETGHHMYRVGAYSRLLAEQMGQPLRFCTEIERFAPLHDVGKVGISDSILLAPRRLTEEEFRIIKQHTTLGHSILADKPSLEMAALIARDHHERYDGKGYPEGRSGSSIDLAARIVSVSDVYDALRSARPYKPPWTHERARTEIEANRGTQFCPDVVDAFQKLHNEFYEVSKSYGDPESNDPPR